MLFDLIREAFVVVLIVSLPIVVVAWGSTLIVNIVTTAFQLSDPLITQAVRWVCVMLALGAFARSIASTVQSFATHVFAVIGLQPHDASLVAPQ